MGKKMTLDQDRLEETIREQRAWIKQHGGTLEAYIKRYGDPGLDYCYGDGGTKIFAADTNALAQMETDYEDRFGKGDGAVGIYTARYKVSRGDGLAVIIASSKEHAGRLLMRHLNARELDGWRIHPEDSLRAAATASFGIVDIAQYEE